MKLSKFSMALFVVAFALPAVASTHTPSADVLLDGAFARAQREKKNVLVIFHASWCGWCKKMDAMLESPEFKRTYENSFVITHVDVLEAAGPQKGLENSGGEELMYSLGATKNTGIPFFAILTPQGVKIGDSLLPNKANMGYPGEPNEIVAFMALLKKTAPKMTDDDRSTIEAFLKTPASKAPGIHNRP